MTESEYSPAHYWKLSGESEEDRLVRLIGFAKAWAEDSAEDPGRRSFWRAEAERLKGLLHKEKAKGRCTP